MTVDLTVRAAIVEDLVTDQLRLRLRSQCPTPWGPVQLDHVDVRRADVAVRATGDGVVAEVTVRVHLTTDVELAAHPNAAPPGAMRPAATATLRYAIRAMADDGAARLRLDPLDPVGRHLSQPFTPLEPVVRDWLKSQQPTLEVPLGGLFRGLHLPAPVTAETALTQGVIIASFDPSGPATPRLSQGDHWAGFLDRAALDAMARELVGPSLVGPNVPAGTTIERIDWAPVNGHPVLKVRVGSHPSVTAAGLTIAVHAWVDVTCALALVPATAATPSTPARLRTNVAWSFHLSIPGPASLAEGLIEGIVEKQMRRQFNAANFGGQPTGDKQFVIDRPLEAPAFLGAASEFTTLQGLPDGALLTGRVIAPRIPPQTDLAIEPASLTPPLRIQFCSELARSGDGRSRGPQTVDNSHTTASVRLRGIGTLCSWRVLSPNTQLVQPYVADETTDDVVAIHVRIPYATALKMTAPLRIQVATTGGVRLFDLGLPPRAEVDAAGAIVDGWDWYIPNCLHLTPEQLRHRPGIGWGLDEESDWSIDRFRPPPLEDPDWTSYATIGEGLSVQLVTVTGLEPGELVQLRSPSHAIDVTADVAGRVSVPALVPMADTVPPTLLQRASGAPLPATVDVATADLRRVAHLEVPGVIPDVLPTRDLPASVGAILARLGLSDLVDVPELMLQLAEDVSLDPQPLPEAAGDETELNPQPLPPHPDELRERLGLADLVEVVPIPGFEQEPLAVAVLADGTKLVVDLTGEPRVAGTFRGPIGPVRRSGRWAVAEGPGRLALLHVRA